MTADERVVRIVQGSVAYRAADAALRAVQAGWTGSCARAALERVAADRARFWSLAVLTAAATALVLAPLGADPRPLSWLVPAFAASLSLVILVGSPW